MSAPRQHKTEPSSASAMPQTDQPGLPLSTHRDNQGDPENDSGSNDSGNAVAELARSYQSASYWIGLATTAVGLAVVPILIGRWMTTSWSWTWATPLGAATGLALTLLYLIHIGNTMSGDER